MLLLRYFYQILFNNDVSAEATVTGKKDKAIRVTGRGGP
jgi:hypothetical protein